MHTYYYTCIYIHTCIYIYMHTYTKIHIYTRIRKVYINTLVCIPLWECAAPIRARVPWREAQARP